ncbi:hypothetical protein MLD38_031618 [Melastoma candidum]|uniref:Uncharacterized protein n=1 Tax=Melastoma candidum TaxID=119954 RepID=A0ACB9MS89_9MYRT|nr:hypothetical protein MLD38_031618 [Melastoma candidum]
MELMTQEPSQKHKRRHYLMLVLALFGSCMMINDGILTPAISVLSASKGVERSLSDVLSKFYTSNKTELHVEKYVAVPSACAVQILLFTIQRCGTDKIGFLFAPVINSWLLFISGIGTYNIYRWNPEIIRAFSPAYMYRFMKNIHKHRWGSLGSVLLCIAGSEAMFADLGHFSKRSVAITFSCFVYPALVLSYAGQAAYISKNWRSKDFNHLLTSIPKHFRHAYVILSLLASAVGSQATITASFSIINQCLALGCFPRVKVIHTSEKIRGQVYIPDINWFLMILSLAVTVGFDDIKNIGYVTGMAVISGILITTCLMSLVIALYWEKSPALAVCFLVSFGFIEVVYLSACLCNFHLGSWYIILLSAMSLTVMLAWYYGTVKKYKFNLENRVSTEWLAGLGPGLGISRVPGIGFTHTDIVTGIPSFFSHFVTNIPAFHQILIFVSFKPMPLPYVAPEQRFLIGRVGSREHGIFRCIVRYGYRDHVRDTYDFEDEIISSIGEFISLEKHSYEDPTPTNGRMLVVGNTGSEGNALLVASTSCSIEVEPGKASCMAAATAASKKRKKVRFILPPEDVPNMEASVREELQKLVDARESGMTYILGKSHIVARKGSNPLKRFLIQVYVFLEKNSREPPLGLHIPQAALVEVGMISTI